MHRLFAPEPLKRRRNCRSSKLAEPIDGPAPTAAIEPENAAASAQHLCCGNRPVFQSRRRQKKNLYLFQYLVAIANRVGGCPYAAIRCSKGCSMNSTARK
jgi:hypothetical protein